MKLFFSAMALTVVSLSCDAASVIALDQGINTNKIWDARNVTEPFQVCSSSDTVYRRNQNGQPPAFSHLSLCKNENAIQFDTLEASQYLNKKKYTDFGQHRITTQTFLLLSNVVKTIGVMITRSDA